MAQSSFKSRFLQKNESLQHTGFINFLLLRFCLILGLNMQTTVLFYLVYELTKDTPKGAALYLGYTGLAEVIPAIVTSLFAGHFVDQREKRGMLMKCIVAYLLLSIFFVVVGWPFFKDKAGLDWTLILIYSGIFIGGIIRAFYSPSAFALIGGLVPKTQLANATTWSSMAWQGGAVLGPLLGGLMIAVVSYEMSLSSVTLLMVICLGAILAIPKQPLIKREKEPILKSLGEGLKFVFSNQLVLAALSLDTFAVLFGSVTAVLPIYANDILKVGELGFGWLRAAPSIGSVITLVILSFVPFKSNPGIKLILAVVGFGITAIIFGISTSFALSLAMLILHGIFDGISVVIRGTILQLKTPDEMRGRVAAVNTMFVSSSNEIGTMESGLAAQWMGVVPSVLFGGTMTILVVLVSYFTAPQLRTLSLEADAEKEKS